MMTKLYSKLQAWFTTADGVTGIEYTFLVGFISVGVMVASMTIGDSFVELFNGEMGASTMLEGALDEAREAGIGNGGGVDY